MCTLNLYILLQFYFLYFLYRLHIIPSFLKITSVNVNIYFILIIRLDTANYIQLRPSWEAASCSATQELNKFYGTRRFTTVFTRAFHCSLTYAKSGQFLTLYSISLRFILILSFYLRLGLSSGLFPSGFPTQTLRPERRKMLDEIIIYLLRYNELIDVTFWIGSVCMTACPWQLK
jgi:hypothetical protein